MAYTPQTWHDYPLTDTPINKATLDYIETGVQAAAATADAAQAGLAGKSDTTHNHTGVYAPVLGVDDNYVTDAEKVKLANLSGTNTGDQDLSSYLTTAAAPELIRDTMGTALVAGSGVTVTPDDVGNTITVAAAAPAATYARVTRAAGQTLGSGALTELLWDTETEDVAGLHSTVTDTGRFVIPSGQAGVYVVSAIVQFTVSLTAAWSISLYKNGVLAAEAAAPAGASNLPFTSMLRLAVTDYIDLRVYQQDGANRTTDPAKSFYAAARIGA